MLREVQTSGLFGPALDWAVGKGEGVLSGDVLDLGFILEGVYSPSTDWAVGGPLIERWEIDLKKEGLRTWRAKTVSIGRMYTATGFTPLAAAMRCYVEGKLGDSVFIPVELLEVK